MEKGVPIPSGNFGPLLVVFEVSDSFGDEKSLLVSGGVVAEKLAALLIGLDACIADGEAFRFEAMVAGMEHAGGAVDAPDDQGVTSDCVDFQLTGEVLSEGFFAWTEGHFFDGVALVGGEGVEIFGSG